MARKRGLPDWAYYLIAALLTLPTLPVYWYFFTQHVSRDPVQPAQAVAPQVSSIATRVPSPVIVYGERLPAGYACAGSQGLVYRHRVVDGAVVIEPLYQGGQLVHCDRSAEGSVVLRGQLSCLSSGFVMETFPDGHAQVTDVRCSAVWHR